MEEGLRIVSFLMVKRMTRGQNAIYRMIYQPSPRRRPKKKKCQKFLCKNSKYRPLDAEMKPKSISLGRSSVTIQLSILPRDAYRYRLPQLSAPPGGQGGKN